MEIYIVQEGDTLYTIAESFGVAVDRLAQDNGINYPYTLLIGQALIIAFPREVHIVQIGDTLQSIAEQYQVPVMQILRNNSFLSERNVLYPGETLVISYYTSGNIYTNGYVYAFIKKDALIKILPNLTFLSVLNYRSSERGEIIQFRDDEEIIKTALEYGVSPLLMISTLSAMGEPNIEVAYSILMSEEYQNRSIENILEILKRKGYHGINMVFNYLNISSQPLYINFVRKISQRIKLEGMLFYITINIKIEKANGDYRIEQVDYSTISSYVDGLILLKFVWGANEDPPAPVSNINYVRKMIEYLIQSVPPEKIMIGNPILGYDWKLPYIPERTVATSMTINSVYELAYETNAVIQYDEESLTPYFYYNQLIGIPVEHIVWFIDVRSINAINELVKEYNLGGSGIWNIMFYYPQLWTSINSQFDIIKLIP